MPSPPLQPIRRADSLPLRRARTLVILILRREQIAEYMRVGRRPVAMLEALRSARSEQLRNLASQDPVESSSLTRSAEWLYLPARVRP